MSSYTFSHQFYQRWTRAPEVIRRAITQELADITTLLQPETNLDTYQFSIEDLDAHLDVLTREHDAKLKAEAERKELEEKQRLIDQEKQDREARRQKREQAERLADEKAAKDKQRREVEKVQAEQAAIEDTKYKSQQEPQHLPTETDDNIAKSQETDIAIEENTEQQSLADDVDALFEDIRAQNKSATSQENSEKEEAEQDLALQDDNSDSQANTPSADQDQTLEAETADAQHTDNTAAENLATEIDKTKNEAAEKQEVALSEDSSKSDEKAPSNEAQKDLPESLTIDGKSADDITQALSNHLDDFLTDKMMQLSEDLKSWLKEEVSRQLAKLDAKNKQEQK